MTFIPILRLAAATLFVALLIPSTGRSQTAVQMDSLYATIQQAVRKKYPNALFAPILHDKYVVQDEPNPNGETDASASIVDEIDHKYPSIFPWFSRWDITSKKARKDPTHAVNTYYWFFYLDSASGTLMHGEGSLYLLHKKKQKASAPDQYVLSDPKDDVDGIGPREIMPRQCERLLEIIPKEHPLYVLADEHCPKEEE